MFIMKTYPYLLPILTLCLHVTTTLAHQQKSETFKYFVAQNDGKKDTSPLEKLPEILDNKDIDVDVLKRRDQIRRHRQHIGRPVPTKGSFQDIGDGVYFVNDNQKAKQKSELGKNGVTGKNNKVFSALSSTTTSNHRDLKQEDLTSKIHSIDLDDRNIGLDAVGFSSKLDQYPNEDEYSKIRDTSAHESIQDNAVGFVGNDNLEGMSNNEESMLKKIEKNLGLDDRLTGLNMAHEAEMDHKIEEARKNTKVLSEFQKVMAEGRQELDLASSDPNGKEMYKKDLIGGQLVNNTLNHAWKNISDVVEQHLKNGDVDIDRRSTVSPLAKRNTGRDTDNSEKSVLYSTKRGDIESANNEILTDVISEEKRSRIHRHRLVDSLRNETGDENLRYEDVDFIDGEGNEDETEFVAKGNDPAVAKGETGSRRHIKETMADRNRIANELESVESGIFDDSEVGYRRDIKESHKKKPRKDRKKNKKNPSRVTHEKEDHDENQNQPGEATKEDDEQSNPTKVTKAGSDEEQNQPSKATHPKEKKKNPKKTNKSKPKFKNEAKELAGLIKVLNKTEGSNPKLRLKAKQHSLKISDSKKKKFMQTHGEGSSSTQIDAYMDKNSAKLQANLKNHHEMLEKRKTKSEVEQIVGESQYIASPALPADSSEEYINTMQTPTEEVDPITVENGQQRSYFAQQPQEEGSNQAQEKSSLEGGRSDQPEFLQATPPEVPPQQTSEFVQSSFLSSSKNQKEGSNNDKLKEADLEDAISDFNSAEIKTAMADSDLKGLGQIKNALDNQNTKNAVEFFHQPKTNNFVHKFVGNNVSEISLGELSEEFKEAEKGYDEDLISKRKTESADVRSKSPSASEKLKIVLHLSDDSSKLKDAETTMETIKQITDHADQLFGGSSSTKEIVKEKKMEEAAKKNKTEASPPNDFGLKSEDEVMRAASIIQSLIKHDDVLVNDVSPSRTSDVSSSESHQEERFFAKPKENSDNEVKHPLNDNMIEDILKSKAFQKYFAKPTESQTGTTRSWMEVGSSFLTPDIKPNVEDKKPHEQEGTYKAFVKTVHEQALNGEKFQGAEGTLESFTNGKNNKLRINGGKVLGGSVRGGNILGGEISGGDVSGGEVKGGKIYGGTFKGGQLVGGDIRNGIIEGGKIRGGHIEGGLLKSGLVDGGVVRGGIVEGGHLVNGTIEGGDFKGGEMLGGKLEAGEIDGGVLKGGVIAGGTLKGGVIESGRLEGGTMLSGLLRGGVVKSGIIKGGIIDEGVVVQDNAEIGPGVEIHEGIVKGGRITVSRTDASADNDHKEGKRTQTPTLNNHTPILNRSTIYQIELDDSDDPATVVKADKKDVTIKPVEKIHQEKPVITALSKTDKVQYFHPTKSPSAALAKHNIPIQKQPLQAPVRHNLPKERASKIHAKPIIQYPPISRNTVQKQLLARTKPQQLRIKQHLPIDRHNIQLHKNQLTQRFHIGLIPLPRHFPEHIMAGIKSIHKMPPKHLVGVRRQLPGNQPHPQFTGNRVAPQVQSQQFAGNPVAPQQQMVQQYAQPNEEYGGTGTTVSPFKGHPIHWALTEANRGVIAADNGKLPKLHLSGDGVTFRNGHAILDGESGFLDAGDYRGECFSDPEACSDGFTFHFTLKIYGNSVNSAKKLYIVDSGAVSKDSRGVSIWVTEGNIKALVSTRKQTYCISKDFQQYADHWLVVTLTWRKDKGASLYLDCDRFDDSSSHFTIECEPQCPDCHQMDVATRLMIGRPNKGPHFSVIHMAVGDISLYEKYHEPNDVKALCDNASEKPNASPQQGGEQQQGQQPTPLPQIQQPPNSAQQQQQQQQQQDSSSQAVQPQQQENTSNQQQQDAQQQAPPQYTTSTTTTQQPPLIDPQLLNRQQSQQVAQLIRHAQQQFDAQNLYPKPRLVSNQAQANTIHQQTRAAENPYDRSILQAKPAIAQHRTRSQYPSPPVTKYFKPVVRLLRNDTVDSKNNNKKYFTEEKLLYPTPPGISERVRIYATESPQPLVDYKTDRRSSLFEMRRRKTKKSNLKSPDKLLKTELDSLKR